MSLSSLCLAQKESPNFTFRSPDPLVERIANLEILVEELNIKLERVLLENQSGARFSWSKVEFGMGLGFHAFKSIPQLYVVNTDSSILKLGRSRGITSMLNAYLSYDLKGHSALFFNLPLLELARTDQEALGMFYGNYIMGLGYMYKLPSISFYGAINFQPYKAVPDEILQGFKSNEEKYTVIDISTMPNYTVYSPSISIGGAFNLSGLNAR